MKVLTKKGENILDSRTVYKFSITPVMQTAMLMGAEGGGVLVFTQHSSWQSEIAGYSRWEAQGSRQKNGVRFDHFSPSFLYISWD